MIEWRTSLLLLASVLLSACQSVPDALKVDALKPEPVQTVEAPAPVVPAVTAKTTKPSLDPDKTPRKAAVDKLFAEAQQAARGGNIKEAMAHFNKLIETQSDFPRVHTRLALLQLHSNQLDDANTSLIKAIEQDARDAIAYNHLAIIARRQERFNDAQNYYAQALAIDPNYAEAHLNLGILYDIYLQDLSAALDHYQQFQALNNGQNENVNKWILDLKRRMAEKS